VDGFEAQAIEFANYDDKSAGYSPVWKYTWDATHDENEYLLSWLAQEEWDANFVNQTEFQPLYQLYMQFPKYYQNVSLPCVEYVWAPPPPPSWFPPPPPTSKPPKSKCLPDTPVDSPPDTCGVSWFPIPADWMYFSQYLYLLLPEHRKGHDPGGQSIHAARRLLDDRPRLLGSDVAAAGQPDPAGTVRTGHRL